MSIENPSENAGGSKSVEEAMKELIMAQVKYNPEYQNLNLTPEEIDAAALRLSNAEVTGTDKELADKAIRAQLGARRNRAPVTSKQGEVIGMADSKQAADTLYRQDNETRDVA